MSNTAKLSGALPANVNLNGLDAQLDDLVAQPQTVRTAVVTYTVEKIVRTPDDGIEVPTIRLRRFEPVPASAVSEALLEAAGTRTGQTPLPIDQIEVVDEGSNVVQGEF